MIGVQILLHLARGDSYQVVRPFTRRCSSRSVRWKRSMYPFDCGLPTLRGPVLDLLELEEQLVGVLVRPGRRTRGRCRSGSVSDLHPGASSKKGSSVVVQDLDRGHRHLRGVEPRPHVAAEAVQHGLDVDLAHPLQRARRRRCPRPRAPRLLHLDVPLAVLGIEALQRLDLLLAQLDLPLRTVSSSRRSRWWRVRRSLRIQTPRTPPELTWIPLSISSSATR